MLNLVLVDTDTREVLGTVEDLGSKDFRVPAVRDSFVNAVENLLAIDVEYTLVETAA